MNEDSSLGGKDYLNDYIYDDKYGFYRSRQTMRPFCPICLDERQCAQALEQDPDNSRQFKCTQCGNEFKDPMNKVIDSLPSGSGWNGYL